MSKNSEFVDLTAAWVPVSTDGLALCQVTLVGSYLPALVVVASSAPANSLVDGARLTTLDKYWSVNDLVAPQKVWARAAGVSARIMIN